MDFALKFGPAEYFSLMVLGLVASIVLAHGSLLKAVGMILLGLLLGLIGTDVNSGIARYSFGVSELSDGIGFVSVALGMFGYTEVIKNVELGEHREIFTKKVGSLLPSLKDLKEIPANIKQGLDIRRELARAVVGAGWGLLELRPMRMSLEEIFLSLTTEEASHAPSGEEAANA